MTLVEEINLKLRRALVFLFAVIVSLPLVSIPQAVGQSTLAPQAESPPASPESPPVLDSWEIEMYKKAPTLIDWTVQQIERTPALKGLELSANQGPLAMVLERAGQTGSVAFADFPNLSCDESITSEAYQGTQITTKKQKFRYIVLPQPSTGMRILQEYRTDLKGQPPDKLKMGSLFMVTSGFASSWLYLSPEEQPDSHFRYFGTQTIRNRECHVVGFAQIPDRARRVGEISVRNQEDQIALQPDRPRPVAKSSNAVHEHGGSLVQGFAWIDSQTFQTLRVMTWLLAPRMDLGVNFSISTVDFDAVQPSGSDRPLWLPRDVNVWVVYTNGTGVRNTHQYSEFKLFRVESTIKP